MSFLLELTVPDLTEQQGRRIRDRSIGEATWPIGFSSRQRRFPWLRARGPFLWLPEEHGGQDLLGDDATWNAAWWAMNEQALPAFAAAIELLGQELDQGFSLRATWVGSEICSTRTLSVRELADLARASRLNEFTSYVVPDRRDPSLQQ